MAYNTKKGSQHSGDIQYEGDPNDTQIDFENDTVALKTNGTQRFVVTGSAITGSTYRFVFKPEELPDAFRITVGGTSNSDNIFRIDTDSGYFHTTTGYKWRFGSDTAAPTHTISVTGDISGSSTLQAVGAATFGSHLVTSGNVGVGVSTADTHIHANRATTTAGQAPAITLSRDDATITGADTLGRIYFAGTEDGGSNWLRGASIAAKAGGAWAGGDIPTTLAISTCPDGSDTLTTALLVGSDQSLSGSGALHVDGATTIGNTFAATGSIVAGTTVTAGSGLIGNTLDIGGSDLVVTAAGNLSGSGTLQAVGTTRLGSLLIVSGAALLGAGAIITGNTSGSGTLYNAGAATFSSTVSSTGSISSSASLIGNVLNIGQSDYLVTSAGNASGSGTLQVVGATILGSTLTVSGALTGSQGKFDLSTGNVIFSGSIYGDGSQLTGIDSVSGSSRHYSSTGLETSGFLKASGSVTLPGILRLSGSIYNAGPSKFRSTVDVSGSVTAGSVVAGVLSGSALTGSRGKFDLSTGNVIFSGSIYGDGSQLTGIDSVSGSSRHYSSTGLETSGFLKASGSVTLPGILRLSGSIYNAGPSKFRSTVDVSGSVTAVGLYSTDLISGSLGIHVDAPATFGGSVSATGSVSTTAGISASADLQIVGSGTFSHDVAISGNLGIGVSKPIYDLHINGAGVTIATIDGGSSSDAYLKMATAGTEKAYLKLGSGGNLILAQDATGGDLQLKAKPGGVSTTYINLDGGNSNITASVDIHAQGAMHHSGAHYRKYISKSTDYTLTNADNIVYIGHSTNNLTASLPDAETVSGIVYTIKNSNEALVVIKPNGSQTIDGRTSLTGSIGMAWTLAAQDDIWQILSSYSSSV